MFRFVVVLCTSALLTAGAAAEGKADLLISQGAGGSTPSSQPYYGGDSWPDVTAMLDDRFTITVKPTLDDLDQMLTFDCLWIDQRWITGTMTAMEINNVQAFIASGRRVVIIGENNVSWSAWNSQILALVGGGPVTSDGYFGPATALDVPPLTDGITTVDVLVAALVAGGTPLFDQNWATLWGANDNVVTVFDTDPWGFGWNNLDNAAFAENVADWLLNKSTPCTGDIVNNDDAVDFDDLAFLLGCWGPFVTGCEAADIATDGGSNGQIDFDDLALLLGQWGPCP